MLGPHITGSSPVTSRMICTSRMASSRRPACSTPAMNSIGSTSVGRIVFSDLAMAWTVRPAAGDGVPRCAVTHPPLASALPPRLTGVSRACRRSWCQVTQTQGSAGNGTAAAPSCRRLRGRQLGAVLLATLDQGGEDLREQLLHPRLDGGGVLGLRLAVVHGHEVDRAVELVGLAQPALRP